MSSRDSNHRPWLSNRTLETAWPPGEMFLLRLKLLQYNEVIGNAGGGGGGGVTQHSGKINTRQYNVSN